MKKQIDVRGLSCPEPVMRTRRAMQDLASGDTLEVVLETVTSRENVLRTLHSLGCAARVEALGENGFRLTVTRP